MRHQRARGKLGLKTAPRKALLSGLASELGQRGRIQTTYRSAKETQRLVERLVTTAKKNTLHARRTIVSVLRSEDAARAYMTEVAPSLGARTSGYTRIIHHRRRTGDGASVVLLEFVDPIQRKTEAKPVKEKKKKPAASAPTHEKETKKDIKGPSKTESVEETKKESKAAEEEKPKKGGFLSGLRKFLKGEDA